MTTVVVVVWICFYIVALNFVAAFSGLVQKANVLVK